MLKNLLASVLLSAMIQVLIAERASSALPLVSRRAILQPYDLHTLPFMYLESAVRAHINSFDLNTLISFKDPNVIVTKAM